MAEDRENDLPFVSNVADISVKHYIFDFACNFKEKCFKCHVVLFLEPVINEDDNISCKCEALDVNVDNFFDNLPTRQECVNTFKLILDSHKIIVSNVEEVLLSHTEQESFKYSGGYNPMLFQSSVKLNFVTDKWSLKVWKNGHSCKLCFPKFIRVDYETVSDGPSLLWVTDQDKK